MPVVRDVSFEARAGDGQHLAGVQGNGQTELIKALLGLIKPSAGEIWLDGDNISKHGPRQSLEDGIGYIPEDRHRAGSIADMSLTANAVLEGFGGDVPADVVVHFEAWTGVSADDAGFAEAVATIGAQTALSTFVS